MKNKKDMKKTICKTCFNHWRSDGEDWCKIIENEGGGSIPANKTECDHYLKKGTEPKWLCCKCGKNVFGEPATAENKKWYCSDCWWKKETKERKIELAKKQKQMVGELLEVIKKYLK